MPCLSLSGRKYHGTVHGITLYYNPKSRERAISLRDFTEENFLTYKQVKTMAKRGEVRIIKFKHLVFVAKGRQDSDKRRERTN